MSTIKLVVKMRQNLVDFENVFHYWNSTTFASNAIIGEVMTDFISDVVLASWQDWTSTQLTFLEVVGSAYDNPFTQVAAVGETGALTTDNIVMKPAYSALIVKETVNSNFVATTGAPYLVGRPVRGGRKFITGLTEGFEAIGGYINPGGTIGTAFDTFLGTFNDVRTGGGVDWTPVILGLPLPANGTLPARTDGIVAPVTGAVPQRFTTLRSRLT